MRLAVMLTALALTACASDPSQEGYTVTTNATKIPYANNQTAWLLDCAGNQMGACYKRAAAVCPTGYQLANSQTGSASAAILPNGVGGATVVQNNRVNLTVTCS